MEEYTVLETLLTVIGVWDKQFYVVSKETFFNHICSDPTNPYLHITISHSALSYPLEAEMNKNIFTLVLFDLIEAIYDSIRNMTKKKYIYFHLLSIPC